jgi:hypothetical protein
MERKAGQGKTSVRSSARKTANPEVIHAPSGLVPKNVRASGNPSGVVPSGFRLPCRLLGTAGRNAFGVRPNQRTIRVPLEHKNISWCLIRA